MTEYLIRLPWPPAKTSPNASGQGKWRAKSGAARAYKKACAWECAIRQVRALDCDAVDVEVTFCPTANRRYDLDNMLARSKQGLDAVAEAIGVDDGDWRSMRLIRGPKVKDGCIVVHIKPLKNIQIRGAVE